MRNRAAAVVFAFVGVVLTQNAYAGGPGAGFAPRSSDRSTVLQRLNPFQATGGEAAAKRADRKSERAAAKMSGGQATRLGRKQAALRARMAGEARGVRTMMKVNHAVAEVAVGAGIAGLLVGSFAGGSSIATMMANNLESTTIGQVAHVTTDSPADDAKFAALASGVHYVDHETVHVPWPVQYHDHNAQSVAAFHNLTTALLTGKLPPNTKYLTAAIGAGEVLSGDYHARYGTTTEGAVQVENDTALLKAKLAGALSPTAGPSTLPAGVGR